MNAYDLTFILALMAFVAIFVYKFYNVVRRGELYTFWTAFLLYAGNGVIWLYFLVILLNDPEQFIYITTFTFASYMLGIHTLFLIIELFYGIAKQTTQPIQPYTPPPKHPYAINK